MLQVEYIVIHHAACEDNAGTQWQSIRQWHHARGWDDIGYHLGIELINGEYEALLGRPWTMNGAHAPGFNQKGLGLCLVGNFEVSMPPERQLDKLFKTLTWLMSFFKVPPDKVIGHYETGRKTACPGKHLDMDLIRKSLRP